MLLSEIFDDSNLDDIVFDEELTESAKRVWARRNNKLVRRFRCTTGRRKGRIVTAPADCNKPIDIKKRTKFKRTLSSKGARMRRKARRTKRVNPVSKRVASLNRMSS